MPAVRGRFYFTKNIRKIFLGRKKFATYYFIGYHNNMLSGIRIYTKNDVWRKILTDLGAIVADGKNTADADIDSMKISGQVSAIELKSIILNAVDDKQRKIINKVFGHYVNLPRLQMRLVALLSQSGPMSAKDIKNVLGYLPDMATHTVDNAIYQLRKSYGREFIQNKNGEYYIGKL